MVVISLRSHVGIYFNTTLRIVTFNLESNLETFQTKRMEAWVTLATNDSYALGALTLAQSLKRVQTSKSLVVMITSEVSEAIKSVLEGTFEKVVVVDPLDSKDIVNLKLLDRTELGITFTKVSRQVFYVIKLDKKSTF